MSCGVCGGVVCVVVVWCVWWWCGVCVCVCVWCVCIVPVKCQLVFVQIQQDSHTVPLLEEVVLPADGVEEGATRAQLLGRAAGQTPRPAAYGTSLDPNDPMGPEEKYPHHVEFPPSLPPSLHPSTYPPFPVVIIAGDHTHHHFPGEGCRPIVVQYHLPVVSAVRKYYICPHADPCGVLSDAYRVAVI